MTGMRGETVNYVWLVWDGPGGIVFEVCADERSAAIVRKYNAKRSRNIEVRKFEVRTWEAWKR